MNKRVLIIGGGLGGLFTGAILAKEGLGVTVLEKNAIIGGGLQSFTRFGECFDTGMHIIGGMQKDGNIRRLCEYLGIWKEVHIKDTDPENIDRIYFSEDGRTYTIAQGRSGFVESLGRAFPDQKDNLAAYVDALYRLADEVDLFYLRPSTEYMQVHSDEFQMSVNGFIDKYISDPHLRSIAAYLSPLYGGREDVTPAYIHALISVLYIDGSSRFAGGSIRFAETLKGLIERCGGRVIPGDGVKAVHSEGRMITGVTTLSGRDYAADCYICAIHPCSFFALLDDRSLLPKPYLARLGDLPNSYSAFTVNIKLKPHTLKYFNYTMYYMSRYDAIWEIGETERWPCGFLYITPPAIDQGEYASKVIVTAPMPWRFVRKWEQSSVGARGADYEAWKARCTEKLLACMEEVQPGFRACIEAVNSASPLTIRDFYGVKEGTMYGFSKDCNNLVLSQVPVVTKVPNLLLTGQNCNLHGFCGVSLTAINTSEALLGRNCVLNKINRFNDIRPHYNAEIHDALRRLCADKALPRVASWLDPDGDVSALRSRLERTDSVEALLRKVLFPAVERLLGRGGSRFTCTGLEGLEPGLPCVFVSQSGDPLEALLLSYALFRRGLETPEIGLDRSALPEGFPAEAARCIGVFDAGTAVPPAHLSDYLVTAVRDRRQSVWIGASVLHRLSPLELPAVSVELSCAWGAARPESAEKGLGRLSQLLGLGAREIRLCVGGAITQNKNPKKP